MRGFYASFLLIPMLLAIAVTGDAGGPKVQSLSRFTVYDAHNKSVGPSLGAHLNKWPTVALRVNGVPLLLYVSPTRFLGTYTALMFTEPDCSGTPYVSYVQLDLVLPNVLPHPDPLFPITSVLPPGNTVWAQVSGERELLHIHSILRGYGESNPGSCDNGDFADQVVFKAAQIIDLFTVFTPPFTVR